MPSMRLPRLDPVDGGTVSRVTLLHGGSAANPRLADHSRERTLMANGQGLSRAARFLLYGAAFVIVLAGVRTAEPVLVPFLLAVMLAGGSQLAVEENRTD